MDRLVEEIILAELRKHPQGRTEKQLYRAVKKKLKKLKKALDIIYEM